MLRMSPLIILLLSLILYGCCPLTSMHPLSSPSDVKYDNRLQGVWRLQTEDDDIVYLHIGKGKDGKTQIVSIEHKHNGELDIASFVMFPTEINDGTYMSLRITDISDQSLRDHPGYYFLRYVISDKNRLFVSHMDENIIIEAIKSGKLKGKITYRAMAKEKLRKDMEKAVDCVQLTDTTQNIVSYIKKADIDRLFPDNTRMVFHREPSFPALD